MINQRWENILQKSHIAIGDTSNECFATLLTLHQESHRYYHTFDHVSQMLWLLEVADMDSLVAQWATFYHDAYYVPGDPENEQRSADLARNHLLRLGVEAAVVQEVETIIVATKTHRAEEGASDSLGAVLDADMAILGSAAKDYEAYCEKVRLEFSGIQDDMYRAGRARFLSSVLAQERIYLTEYFYGEFEEYARVNISRELASIEGTR